MAAPAPTATPSSPTTESHDRTLFHLLEQFQSYPFTTDPEFKLGLAALLKKRVPSLQAPTTSSTPTPASRDAEQEQREVDARDVLTDADLARTDDFVTSAKLFFFSRKRGLGQPLSLAVYKAFLAAQNSQVAMDVDVTVTARGQAQAKGQGQGHGIEAEGRGEGKDGEVRDGLKTAEARTVEVREGEGATSMRASVSVANPSAGPAPAEQQQQQQQQQPTVQPKPQLPETTTQPPPQPETQPSPSPSPSYPTSFAHIVELITTGQPIPGIQEIPDTVLTGKETKPSASKRRKPWEKEGEKDGSEGGGLDLRGATPSVYGNPVNEGRGRGEGEDDREEKEEEEAGEGDGEEKGEDGGDAEGSTQDGKDGENNETSGEN